MRRLLTFISATMLQAVLLFAQDSGAQLLAAMDSVFASTSTLSCDFDYTVRNAMLKMPVTMSGKLYYSRPDKVHLDLATAADRNVTLIMNGSSVQMRSAAASKTVDLGRNSMMRGMMDMILQSVSGSCFSAADSRSITVSQDGALWTLQMAPLTKQEQKIFKSLTAVFDSGTSCMKSFTLVDVSGSLTSLEFKNVQRNAAFGDDIFTIENQVK